MQEKLKIKVKRLYYDNKQIRSEIQILNGKKQGICREWYRNGQIKDEREFKGGVMNGIWREWHENGQISWDSIQTNGWPYNSHQRAWYKDGKLKMSSEYKEGKLHGLVYSCDKNGKEKREYWWQGKVQNYCVEQAEIMIDFLANLGYEIKNTNSITNKAKIKLSSLPSI